MKHFKRQQLLKRTLKSVYGHRESCWVYRSMRNIYAEHSSFAPSTWYFALVWLRNAELPPQEPSAAVVGTHKWRPRDQKGETRSVYGLSHSILAAHPARRAWNTRSMEMSRWRAKVLDHTGKQTRLERRGRERFHICARSRNYLMCTEYFRHHIFINSWKLKIKAVFTGTVAIEIIIYHMLIHREVCIK